MPLSSGVEQWAGHLLSSVHSTLHQLITSSTCSGDAFSLEELARAQVSQVTGMGLFFQWRKECEHALLQCRYDRRALPGARTKFNTWSTSRLVALLMRNTWKVAEEPFTHMQRKSLEALAMVCYTMTASYILNSDYKAGPKDHGHCYTDLHC